MAKDRRLRRNAMRMRELVLVPLAIAATLEFAAPATAQVYPSRPITIIVPFSAGGPGVTRNLRRWRLLAYRRRPVPEANGHALSIRFLSRRGADNAGPYGRADRLDDRSVIQCAGTGAQRHYQGLRGRGQEPPRGSA